MATRGFVPQNDGEGYLGSQRKRWDSLYVNDVSSLNISNDNTISTAHIEAQTHSLRYNSSSNSLGDNYYFNGYNIWDKVRMVNESDAIGGSHEDSGNGSINLALQSLVNRSEWLSKNKADLLSPAFTGTPTAPTPDSANANQIATVSFVAKSIEDISKDIREDIAEVNNDSLSLADGGTVSGWLTVKNLTLKGEGIGSDNITTDGGISFNGLFSGGDSADAVASQDANVIVNSWQTTGFKTNYNNIGFTVSINHRTGDFKTLGNISAKGNITIDGSINAAGNITGAKVFNAVWNDYAELFPKNGKRFTAGDILALDVDSENESYHLATEDDYAIAGVVSDSYAILIGGDTPPQGVDYVEHNLVSYAPIALAGRVLVKFVGEAKKGSFVVPSSVPGVGRMYDALSDNNCQIIGFLIEDDDKSDIRKLRIKVK